VTELDGALKRLEKYCGENPDSRAFGPDVRAVLDALAAVTRERDEARAALGMLKTEIQWGRYWEARSDRWREQCRRRREQVGKLRLTVDRLEQTADADLSDRTWLAEQLAAEKAAHEKTDRESKQAWFSQVVRAEAAEKQLEAARELLVRWQRGDEPAGGTRAFLAATEPGR
jgi:hypothetical protein